MLRASAVYPGVGADGDGMEPPERYLRCWCCGAARGAGRRVCIDMKSE